jgi:hypothetical protein
MQKKLHGLFFLVTILIVGISKAQNFDSLTAAYRAIDPQEKIYVHFDKNYYNAGETVWFKAYIFAGIEPSTTSKNFFAELVDEDGTVLNRKTAPVFESSAAGSFDVAATFAKPVLYFRAYTTNMLNGDTAFLYTRALRIITAAKTPASKIVIQSKISFLPEGGDLVANIPSTVAFKATDQNGTPVSATGYIKDKDGKKVIDFASSHDGMGAFTIQPLQGQSYTAVWKDATGKENTIALPVVKPEGVVLQVRNTEGGKKFVVLRSPGVEEASKQLRIVAFMNQHLVYSARATLMDKDATSGTLPTQSFPSGILQVTVFDRDNKPLAERITFINNHEFEFDADAWVPVLNTAKRGLNTVEVMISDTLRSNLSLSITDADLNVPPANADNIISRLLLTGDLRGKIENPYYYFFSTSDSASYYLDLVMLTHGWRRYNWDDVLAGRMPKKKFIESNYISLKGQLIGIEPARLPVNTMLNGILQTKDSNNMFLTLPIDRKGQAMQDGLIFFDDAQLFFQFRDAKNALEKPTLKVDNGLWKGTGKASIADADKKSIINPDTFLIAKNQQLGIEAAKIAKERVRKEQTLQEVVVKAKVKTNEQKLDEKYTSALFSGDARNFDVGNDPLASASLSVFQYLQGRVAGLQINVGGGGSMPQLSWRGGTPVFYLDEMSTDAQMLQNINMADVAYIKVFSPGSVNAFSSSGGGAIAVYTKKGGDVKSDAKGLDKLVLQGYSTMKQFYSPDYATSSPLNDLTDVRSTLYWNPYIFLDSKKKRFKVQFYNNDITKRFRVVLEGINIDGKMVHIEKVLEPK